MSIRTKLLLGFLGVSLVGALIGLVGILSLASIKEADTDAFNNGTQGLVVMIRALNAFDEVKVSLRDEALSTTEVENERAAAAYKNGVEALNKALVDYGATVSDATDRANWEAWKTATEAYLPTAAQVIDYGLQNMNQQATDVLQSPGFIHAKDNLNTAVQKIVDYNITYNTDIFKANSGATDLSILTMVIILGVGILFSILLGLLVTNSIVKPVRRVNDELGEASRSLESASLQVSSSSQQLSSSSSELASSIEEMTSSLEELQSIIEANTKNVNQSELLMQETTRDAKKVAGRMAELKDALVDISGNSKKISKIIKVIDDIAFQTNILALNAAVEATHAGSQGRGFAVVADEIRRFSDQILAHSGAVSRHCDEIGAQLRQAQDLNHQGQEAFRTLGSVLEGHLAGLQTLAEGLRETTRSASTMGSQLTELNASTERLEAGTQGVAQGTAGIETSLSSIADLLREGNKDFREIERLLADARWELTDLAGAVGAGKESQSLVEARLRSIARS